MRFVRFFNPIVSFFVRLGLPMGPQALLTVAGRKTGLPRTTPVALTKRGEDWQLISVYGNVDWARNLRSVGSAVLTMRRRVIPVTSRELTFAEAAPVLRDSLASAGLMVRLVVGRHFKAEPTAPIAAWEKEAARHPVFVLTPYPPAEQWDRRQRPQGARRGVLVYSTVTVFARLRGLSTSSPLAVAT